ncbi:hypothetical protein [Streptomyces sp. NPDC046261]|uniref:hypothetical protein n=1 Tax=Streptomyces sp. NPDC046261 TaxID=3157200 RepID=UPI0033F1FC1B
MPTPYGSRGGMAFSADELRVLRRALDIALRPHSVPTRPGPTRQAEAKDCLRLAEAVDEAVREAARLRVFLLEDLARYRAALPGAAPGYVRRLRDALVDGYRPAAEDLAALRSLCAEPVGEAEATRRHTLLARCEHLAEQAVRTRLAARAATPEGRVPSARPRASARTAPPSRTHRPPAAEPDAPAGPAAVPPARPAPPAPQSRTHLLALPGGRAPQAAEPDPKPGPKPGESPAPPNRPAPGPPPEAPQPKPPPATPRPERPIPTPGEVFPPRRKPTPPPGARALAAARPA